MVRKQHILEILIGLLLIIVGCLLYWWSTNLLWIMIYPPPFEKQLIQISSFFSVGLGILLFFNGCRKLFIEIREE
jgi:hypothetical protein